MTGAELLIQLLNYHQVDTIFGYPGGAVLPIYDALYDCSSIKHVLVRHEQAAVHAADGYARVSGKAGVALVTSGPGATNAVTGIANAYMDSVPLVVLTGQVATSLIGLDSFQEVDIFSMTMSITKHNFIVFHLDDLPQIVCQAFEIAVSGRPGPVLIDLPKDVMAAISGRPYELADFQMAALHAKKGLEPAHIPEELLEQAAVKLSGSRRPVIIAGGGCMAGDGPELLREFAEQTGIPVVSTLMGLGAFPAGHPQYLGMLGMHGTIAANRSVQQADLLLCLGVRFSDRVSGNRQAFSSRSYKIQVDIDSAELNKNIGIDLPLHGRVEDLLRALLSPTLRSRTSLSRPVLFRPENENWADWTAQAGSLSKRAPFLRSGGRLLPQEVLQLIHSCADEDAVIATDVGQHQIWTANHYPFTVPRSFVTSGGLGTMGFGLPAAIGAAIAQPDRQVVCISGDGSIQMNIQELMTAVEQRLNLKIVILTNGYLGMVRQWQQLFCGGRYTSVKLASPMFPELARTFGAKGYHAADFGEAESVVREAWKEEGVVVMEFDITEELNVYPMIPPGAAPASVIEG
ncbi:biosynthetic-type acetolactate synthase large subunit [Paenibacillus sp. CN-4]|uniref:biosynthetic-type acetolactate synthase large subunit n=1 Tax=Paenibacillus nanchangensis TaxID=3348343 RepID=UPI00397ACA18